MKAWQVILLILLFLAAIGLFFYMRKVKQDEEGIIEELVHGEVDEPEPELEPGDIKEYSKIALGDLVSLKYKPPLNKSAKSGDIVEITGSQNDDGQYKVFNSTPELERISLKMPSYNEKLQHSMPDGKITIL